MLFVFTNSEDFVSLLSQQAVQKVGLIGLAIEMPNKASEALIEAASRTPKKSPAEKVC